MHPFIRILLLLPALSSVRADNSKFELNRGQFAPDVSFSNNERKVSTAITQTGMRFRGKHQDISLTFEGARLDRCGPNSPVETETNYLGVAPPLSHVPLYSSVVCPGIYPGIDWVVGIADGSIEHDWRVAAHGRVHAIAMRLDEPGVARMTSGGDLLLQKGELSVIWKAPLAYQLVGGKRYEVKTRYVVHGRKIRLVIGHYRDDLPLVIDPVIDFSQTTDGNGGDRGCQVALDGSGNIYVAGFTGSSNFEITAGAAFGSSQSGTGTQVFVRKLSPDGSKLLYSTYIGAATFYNGHPIGMRVDGPGNVYLAVNVFNQPIAGNGTPIDPGGILGVYKIAPGGDHLVYGTRVIQGSDYTVPVAMAIDSAGDAYVAAGGTSISVSKIDPTGKTQLLKFQLPVSNYFGGLADIAVGNDGSIYLAGTLAHGGIVTTPGAFQQSALNPQNYHGFVTRMKPDGSGPIYSTYVAGTLTDSISALAVDSSGAAYVGGQTISQAAPAMAGLAGTSLGLSNALPTSGFVLKLDPTGHTAVFSALLPNQSVNALALDNANNSYAAGLSSTGFTMSKISPTGDKLVYYSSISTPTPTPTPSSMGIAVDATGSAYLASSAYGILVPDPVQSTHLLPNALLLKMDANPGQCDLSVQAQAGIASLPGSPTTLLFTISNSGPSPADNVVFSGSIPEQGPGINACRASGLGVCGTVVGAPWATFDSIAAGDSGTVELILASANSPSGNGQVTASVSTTTSDVNRDNNNVTAVINSADYVSFSVGGSFGATCTVSGAVATRSCGSGIVSAIPNTTAQIFWPSPQLVQGLGLTFAGWTDGSMDNPRTIVVSPTQTSLFANFAVQTGPYIAAAGVTSAANYSGNGVSPGELVTLFGVNLGTGGATQVQNGRFPLTVGSTSVSFDGFAAPLTYVGASQINAVVPYEIAGQTSTKITINSAGRASTVTVPVVGGVPALFTGDGSGSGQAAALNQDGSVNSPANPANPGDVIVLYGTGAGLVSPVPADGTVSSSTGSVPNLPISVMIGGSSAQVQYAADAPGLVSGVIQINAVIPRGIAYSHHVPVTFNAGPYSSPAAVTIAVNDSLTIPGPITVAPDDLSKQPITISPSHIAADTGATKVTLTGTGFTVGMVATWNGQPRTTTFLDATRLQVSLTGVDLELPGIGMLAVWDSTQTEQITESSPILVYVPVLNNDLVYDSLRDRIYIAVAASQKPQGPSIAVLNPELGKVEKWFSLSVEPTKLAISDDDQYLYVAQGNAVQRINLNSWITDLTIALGSDSVYGPRGVLSMMTLPGTNNSLAVSFTTTGAYQPYVGTGVFDDAQLRPGVTDRGPAYLLGGPDAGTLYGADNVGNFYSMAVTSSGITLGAETLGLLGGSGDSVFAGGLVPTCISQRILAWVL